MEDETYQKLLEDTRNAFLELDEALSKKPYSNRVPDAPFRDSWDALAMKRMLRLAAEEGYDKIAWTNGQMQSDRYNLTKVLEDFYYKPNGDGTYKISAALKQRRNGYEDYSDINYDSLTAERIGEIFGKEIAEKVSTGKGRKGYSHNNEGDWVTFKGRDLKVSNEGMRYFYDQKLVNWMNKYGKKWGVQVEDLTLHGLENKEGWHSVDITPEMKESVMEGQVMFSVTDNNLSGFKIAKSDIGAVLNRMEEAAIIPETVPYDITEWNKRLAGKIPTQVGELIMGAHQFVKLDPKFNEQHQDRRGWIGMIDATIHNPLMIVTQDEAGNYQRQFKLVFAKTFKNKEKDDAVFFVSISVLKDTHEAVITSHIRPKKEFGKILENGVVVFSSISMNGIQTEDVQPQLSGTTTPSNKQVGATSKDTNSLDKNNSSDTNFRVTPAQDAEYLAAVEAGDMEKARQMVKEAFLASHPYTEVLDSNGNPKEVLHGTPNKFTVFDKDKIGSNTDAGWLGTGFYFFGNNPEYASQYAKGGRVISAYLDIQNPYLASSSEMNRLADANSREESDAFRKMLEDEGYDGVFYNEDLNEEWVAFEPSQIKSAEPVTYDDNGNVIPLSERFNRGKEDLRFRITPEETPKDTSMEPDVAFASLPIGYAEIQNRLKNEGLAEVGDEDVSDLMMHLFSNANEDIRQTVLANAPSYGYNISKATGYYYASLAQKDELSDAERVAVNKMRDDLAQTVGIDNLRASDALWMMYRTMHPISNDIFDIAMDTEVSAKLGHSPSNMEVRDKIDSGLRLSVTENMHSKSAAEMYNQSVSYWRNRLKEGYVDMNESVNDLMSSMEKATGVKAEEFEDIRIALNQQSSKALNRMKKYTSDYLEPLWQAIADVVSTAKVNMDEVVRYVDLKHALERNEQTRIKTDINNNCLNFYPWRNVLISSRLSLTRSKSLYISSASCISGI